MFFPLNLLMSLIYEIKVSSLVILSSFWSNGPFAFFDSQIKSYSSEMKL